MKTVQTIYDHVLLLNMRSIPKSAPIFECKYEFARVFCLLSVYPKGVCIHKYTANDTNVWSLNPISKDSQDALRKAYIVYSLATGKGLLLKNISVLCDGVKVKNYTLKDDGFPFIFSVLEDRQLSHNGETFGTDGIFGNNAIMKYFTQSKRTSDQNDKRIVALFAFLQGRSREYEVDRFLNYWTAINSLYGYMCIAHASKVEKYIKDIPDELLDKYQLTREELTFIYVPFSSKDDTAQINMFRSFIMAENGVKKEKSKERTRGKEALLREINGDYSNPLGRFSEAYRDSNGKVRYAFERLYEMSISGKKPEDMTFTDEDEKEMYELLLQWGIKVSGSLYGFLSVDEPYYMRNFYIHGSEAPLVISNDYHLKLLSCLNFFMDKLIATYIPVIFSDSKRKNMIDKIHNIIYEKGKNTDYKTIDEASGNEVIKKGNEIAANARKIAKELGEKDHLWMSGQGF